MRNRRQPRNKAAVDVSSDGVETGEDRAPETVSTDSEKPASYRETNMEALGESPVVLDIECGPNKAKFYLDKVQMGSKGQCVFFEDSWLTPNEFQFVSGRETAKDWKRSIKHHDKSLKLLMSRGLLSLSPAECRCENCAEGSCSPSTKEENSGRDNLSPECPSPESDYNSSSPKQQDLSRSRDTDPGTESHKSKSRKRKRDASPKAKGKRRAKKQRRSRGSSDGEKNILKLKRVEDSEEYVSSVIYSPENTLEDRETTGSGDTNTTQGEKKQDAHLSAYDEDTDSYVNDTEGEDVIVDDPNKSTPSVNIPSDERLSPQVNTDIYLADEHPLNAHKEEPGYDHPNEFTGSIAHVPQKPIPKELGVSPKLTGETVKSDTTSEDTEKNGCTKCLLVVRKTEPDVVMDVQSEPLSHTKQETRLPSKPSSPKCEEAKCSALDLTCTGKLLESNTNYERDGFLNDNLPNSSQGAEPLNMALSPKRESRLTNIIEQLRTCKGHVDQKTDPDSKDPPGSTVLPSTLIDRKSPVVEGTRAPSPGRGEATPACNGVPLTTSRPKEGRSPPRSNETTPAWNGVPLTTSRPKEDRPSPRSSETETTPVFGGLPLITSQSTEGRPPPRSNETTTACNGVPFINARSKEDGSPPRSQESRPARNGGSPAVTVSKEDLTPPRSVKTTPVSNNLAKSREPSTVPSPEMDYYQLLKSRAEAIRKAEDEAREKASNKDRDQTGSEPDKVTRERSPQSGKRRYENTVYKGAHGDTVSSSIPAVDGAWVSGLPANSAEALSAFPGSMGLPYMAYPYLHPGLVQGSGVTASGGLPTVPSTTVPHSLLANPLLYSSMYSMYPNLAASLGAGGLGATGLYTHPKLGQDATAGTKSSQSTLRQEYLNRLDRTQSATRHKTIEKNDIKQRSDADKNTKYLSNLNHNSVPSQRYCLSGTVDFSRKTEYAYDKNGALDLTSSLRRYAESKTAPYKAKRSRVVDSYGYKPRDLSVQTTKDATAQGHRDSQGHNRGEIQCRKDSYMISAGDRSRDNISLKSAASVSVPPVSSPSVSTMSSASSPSAAGMSSASITAAMASAHAAALAYGYPSAGSPYAAVASGINPAVFGMMQHPFMYPYSM